MQFVVSFAPWIVYGILDSTSGWQYALVAGLVTSLALLGLKVRRHEPADVLSLGGVAFFALMLAASPLIVGTAFQPWTQTFSQGWIAGIMWLSIVLRRPFTLAFSTREAPEEFVGTPEFLRFNDIITAMWALSFTVGTVVLVLVGSATHPTLTTVIVTASILVPIVAMKRYIAVVTAEPAESEPAASLPAVAVGPADQTSPARNAAATA
ncbi:MAG: hypothetical protein ABI083_07570 [Lapillicoccus sp.]